MVTLVSDPYDRRFITPNNPLFHEEGTSALTEARNVLRVWQGTEQFFDLPRPVTQRHFQIKHALI